MLDLQSTLAAMVAQQRQEALKSSPQLLLGELIARLEAIADKSKLVVYDFDNMKPTSLDSWRGAYAELALGYDETREITINELLEKLQYAVGHTYEGYKGGDFTMGKGTPIWVANYGESGVYAKSREGTTAIISVQDGDVVTLQTQQLDY